MATLTFNTEMLVEIKGTGIELRDPDNLTVARISFQDIEDSLMDMVDDGAEHADVLALAEKFALSAETIRCYVANLQKPLGDE